MKVLLLHSISSTHQAYGKGEHDLPPAFAKKLCDNGLAKPLEAFVEEKKELKKPVIQECVKEELQEPEIVQHVQIKGRNSAGSMGGKRGRPKNSSKSNKQRR